MSLIAKLLVPKTQIGRRVSLAMVFAGVIVYVARIYFYWDLHHVRAAFHDRWLSALFITLCSAINGLIIAGVLILFSIVYAKHPMPVATYIGSLAIAITMPLPISLLPEPEPFPEEVAFETHRADYEAIVELAWRGELEHNDAVLNETKFLLPDELQHLTRDGSVYVRNRHSLEVELQPFVYYYPIVYMDRPGNVGESLSCGFDGWVEVQLDKHWFLCTREWN